MKMHLTTTAFIKQLRIPFFLLLFLFSAASLQAQKIAYVDVTAVLEKIPAYAEKQKELDKISDGWQKEVEAKMQEVDKMYKDFKNDQVLMTEPMKEAKIKEIEAKEKEVKEIQKAKFGPTGELFKKRQELIKPLQDQVYTAIKELAAEKKLDLVLDKAQIGILYTSGILDLTAEITKKLGY